MIHIDKTDTPNKAYRTDIYGKTWSIPDVFVMHTAEGTYNGTIGWEKNSSSQVSSHFVIAKDGRVTMLVPLNMAAFTQGLSYNKSPMSKDAKSKLVKERSVNPNCYCISAEFEGFYKDHHGNMTDSQIDSVIEIIKWCNHNGANIPYDREHIIGHCDINPMARALCPGELFPYDKVINRLNNNNDVKVDTDALYYVQIGAFKNRDNAQAYADKATESGYNAIVKV